jgi:hypothetical protein
MVLSACSLPMNATGFQDMSSDIFVFGSNLAGRHGKGAALHARQEHGAKYGVGVGPQGNAYAIPTRDSRIRTLPLEVIEQYVCDFIEYAARHPNKTFNVTRIGCGLAGYTDAQIAPMFNGAPANCNLPDGWRPMFKHARYHDQGYEVSSTGDWRFSPLFATLEDGRTIEMHYQCDPVDLWQEYLNLWCRWAIQHPWLMLELRMLALPARVLTDRYATGPISQARALAEILNAVHGAIHPAV